jgi:hypothetical protein
VTTPTPSHDDEGFAGSLVEALSAVPGVDSADLAPDADGAWGLLHLDLHLGTDEIGVAAAVGRLLREQFGLSVDTGAIALVEEAHGVARVGDIEAELLRVSTAAHRVGVVVAIRSPEGESRGEAALGPAGQGALRAVAEATLRAVEELTGGRVEADVENVELGTSDDPDMVRVTLTLDPDGVGQQLVALEPLRGDARQATLRATLRLLADRLGSDPD